MARDPHTDLSYAWVNIGGVPGRFADNGEAPVLEGFIGCMQNLVVRFRDHSIVQPTSNCFEIIFRLLTQFRQVETCSLSDT